MEWHEIDLTSARWEIPATKMKMKRPHVVPLSRQAVALLESLYAVCLHGTIRLPRNGPRTPIQRRAIMQSIATKHTGPEMAARRML